MLNRGSQLIMIGGLVLSLTSLVACKSSEAPKAPAKKDQSLDAKDNKKLDTNGDDPAADDKDPPAEAAAATLAIAPVDQASLKMGVGTAANISFKISGEEGKEILVGLMQTVDGAKLLTSGTSVALQWAVPTAGTHAIQFLLRDKQKCVEVEGDEAKCAINEAEYGTLGVKSYDVASATFSLEVSPSTLPGSTTTTTGTGGLGSGGGGGNNGQLITQIIGLLGGNGGGGGNLQGLLAGLSNGQLTQILSSIQNGGGGQGIGQLISLVSGI